VTRLRLAARRLSITLRKTGRVVAKLLPDAHVYAGIGAMAYGASQLPEWIGPLAGFTVLGLGLIWIVRSGAEQTPRRR
jgi:hypothetical protein